MDHRLRIITRCLLVVLCTAACSSAPAKRTKTAATVAAAESRAVVVPSELGKTDFDVHVTELKKRLPSNDFTIVVITHFSK